MAYDPEKYREKREKVLGIKKRGLGFGAIATMVSAVIIIGLSVVTVPQALSYMKLRHLDDAIFKLESGDTWPKTTLESLASIEGINNVSSDEHSTRLVVTFDRRMVALEDVQTRFGHHGLTVTLLNQVNHRQHMAAMKKEKEEEALETP